MAAMARTQVSSLVRQIQDLVAIDSRGERGDYVEVIGAVEGWLTGHGIVSVAGAPRRRTAGSRLRRGHRAGRGGRRRLLQCDARHRPVRRSRYSWTFPPLSARTTPAGSMAAAAPTASPALRSSAMCLAVARGRGRQTARRDGVRLRRRRARRAASPAFNAGSAAPGRGQRFDGAMIGYPGQDLYRRWLPWLPSRQALVVHGPVGPFGIVAASRRQRGDARGGSGGAAAGHCLCRHRPACRVSAAAADHSHARSTAALASRRCQTAVHDRRRRAA